MPQPTLPPTPGASLDIIGKSTYINGPTISLGPAAVQEAHVERSPSATPSEVDSESSYDPSATATVPANKRKQPTRPAKASNDFELPPPPSRSRKIIQMKPRGSGNNQQSDEATQGLSTPANPGSGSSKGVRKRSGAATTSAAGRKMARKTAHSLIERRRRSKMNEEFGVLKDMIPACRGHEMHKLAILQASIDYLRYLEQCMSDLKTANTREDAASDLSTMELDNDDPDSVMSDPSRTNPYSETVSTTRPATSSSVRATVLNQASPLHLAPLSHHSPTPHPSPLFRPKDSSDRSHPRERQQSISSSNANFSPYIVPQSTSASPIFRPTNDRRSVGSLAAVAGEAMQRFSLTSPSLLPVDNSDHSAGATARSDREAMAALLMLNNSDRRASLVTGSAAVSTIMSSSGNSPPTQGATPAAGQEQGPSKVPRKAGAMSVKDLLSPQ